MPRIIRNSRVEMDLTEIVTYLAERNPDAAIAVINEIESAFEQLLKIPDLGRHPRFLPEPRFNEVRMWPISRFPNYLIFYREHIEGIEVIRVMHAARNISESFEES